MSHTIAFIHFLRRPALLAIGAILLTFVLSAVASTDAQTSSAVVTRRVNAPYFDGGITYAERTIFWFGQVNATSNYADVRVGYNDEQIIVHLNVMDRLIWYDTTPSAATLTEWDAATLYLRLGGNQGNAPDAQSYRFVAQMSPSWDSINRADYQAAYRGNGGWASATAPFTSNSAYRGGGVNNMQEARGWRLDFRIPFSSLGLSGPPPPGTVWGLALALHDRDDAAGTPIPDQLWPESMDGQRPLTWGQLHFGLPTYTPPDVTPTELISIRHGVSGVIVPDAHVGGDSVCGSGLDPWTAWGNKNYAGSKHANVQNQFDLADWPCFSKYYLTFPLDALPPDGVLMTATLTLYQFGNAGQSDGREPLPSLMQVLTVGETWSETSITWNNAPLAVENVSQTWVHPIPPGPPYPIEPRQWDVNYAAAQAFANQQPLRLVVYSADSAYSSGKYFRTSDASEAVRPLLQVQMGQEADDFSLSASPLVYPIDAGGQAVFTIGVQKSGDFSETVALSLGNVSPDLQVIVTPTAVLPPGEVTVTAVHTDPTLSDGRLYAIPITATGSEIVKQMTLYVLVNGYQQYLPLLSRP